MIKFCPDCQQTFVFVELTKTDEGYYCDRCHDLYDIEKIENNGIESNDND